MKKVNDFKVVRNKRLNADNHILFLKSLEPMPEIRPGQFVEILVDGAKDVFLRRPFSIHDADIEEGVVKVLIQRVGNGSRQLCYLEEGDFVNMIYPLGNTFSLIEGGEALLVGGGCGVAPLLFLARQLSDNGVLAHILIGGRSEESIYELEEYSKFGKVYVATEDGSLGEKGMVTDHSIMSDLGIFNKIYSCGPKPMMAAVRRAALDSDIDCEVSLENTMACGIGACLCCVEDTTSGNVCVCTEGPVFNVKQLKWQI